MNVESIYETEPTMEPKQLSIVIWPDDALHQTCADIIEFDTDEKQHLQQLVLNMTMTMRSWNGVGIAAPQIGLSANMFLMLVDAEDPTPLVVINPTIQEVSKETFEWEEGCLSVPGYFENRERPNWVRLKFQDVFGKERELIMHGVWAFICQHELDHLNGKMFVDELSTFKRSRVKAKIKKTLNAPTK